MKTVAQIRRENLEALIQEFGTLARVAEAADTTSVYLSQVRNETRDIKTARPRELGSAMARRLEVACSKPEGWMDVEHYSRAHSRPIPANDHGAEGTASPSVDHLTADEAELILRIRQLRGRGKA